MAQKPVVVYIEDTHGTMGLGNFEQEALRVFLEKDRECNVHCYSGFWGFEDDLDQFRKYAKHGLLVLVIVAQEKYSDEQHTRALETVRQHLGKQIPVVVIPDGYRDRFKGTDDAFVYAHDHTDPEFAELIDATLKAWTPPVDWLGADTPADRARLGRQLRRSYRANHPDDERAVAVGDHNHMTVAQALRIRMLPSACLKSEFEDSLERKTRRFDSADSGVYECEVEIVRSMTDEERTRFDESLSIARGHISQRGGGIKVASVSCGSDVNGYAIDPETLETRVTYGFGEHHKVKKLLSYRVHRILAWRKKKHYFDMEDDETDDRVTEARIRARFLNGLIFTKIRGFETPIVQLWTNCASTEQINRAITHIFRERKFIPVDCYGKLYEPSA